MKTVSFDTWDRTAIFQFFSAFDEPYHGITAEVDVTQAYIKAHRDGQAFYPLYLHAALSVVNEIENFRYRIIDGQVVLYDTIHAGTTIPRQNNLFAMAFIPFQPDYTKFTNDYTKVKNQLYHCTDLNLNEDTARLDCIHCSAVPWISFTSLSHARRFSGIDSVPKISFGKFIQRGERYFMPISIHVHHGLVDGYHIGLFLEQYQKHLSQFL